jgi:TP901 family phage tail tape measure protein
LTAVVNINGTNAISTINSINKATRQATTSVENLGSAFGVSLKRFATFSLASRAIGLFTSKLSGAIDEAIEFNSQVIKLSQVTGESISGLSKLTGEIDRLAKTWGVASSQIASTALILAQAGLSATDTKIALEALTKTSLSATFGDISETAEGAVAIIAQFGEGAAALERQLGAINTVSAKFAVESEDLIAVIRRTGGVFKASGGSLEELIALFTSVRATTRESAETIATGLRTIFTRIQRPATIQYLRELGIELIDSEGKFVGPYKAVEQLSKALGDLPQGSLKFIQVAEELGGFRQIGKVIPLLQQFEIAEKARQAAVAGGESLTKDAITAQQALAVQFTKVREEFLSLVRGLTETTSFQVLTKTILTLASGLIRLADALKPIIPLLGALATIKFAQGIGSFASGIGAGLARRNAGGKIHAFASGGLVPGTGNRDTVPAMLSPGEFVVRKSSVNKIGADRLAAMNENRYAAGGIVSSNKSLYGPRTPWQDIQKQFPTLSENQARKIANGTQTIDYYKKRKIIPNTKAEEQASQKKKGFVGSISINPSAIGGFFLRPNKGTERDYKIKRSVSLDKLAGFPKGLYELQGPVSGFYTGKNDISGGNIGKIVSDQTKEGLKKSIVSASNAIRSSGAIDIPPIDGNEKIFEKSISNLFKEGGAQSTIEGYMFEGIVSALSGAALAGGKTTFDYPSTSLNQTVKGRLNSIFRSSGEISKLVKADAKRTGSPENYKDIGDKLVADLKKGITDGVTIKKFASGGNVGTDTVPALLTPGEFVINRSSAQRIGYGNLSAMNRKGVSKFATGGFVKKYATGAGPTGVNQPTGSRPALGGVGAALAIGAVTSSLSSFADTSTETGKTIAEMNNSLIAVIGSIMAMKVVTDLANQRRAEKNEQIEVIDIAKSETPNTANFSSKNTPISKKTSSPIVSISDKEFEKTRPGLAKELSELQKPQTQKEVKSLSPLAQSVVNFNKKPSFMSPDEKFEKTRPALSAALKELSERQKLQKQNKVKSLSPLSQSVEDSNKKASLISDKKFEKRRPELSASLKELSNPINKLNKYISAMTKGIGTVTSAATQFATKGVSSLVTGIGKATTAIGSLAKNLGANFQILLAGALSVGQQISDYYVRLAENDIKKSVEAGDIRGAEAAIDTASSRRQISSVLTGATTGALAGAMLGPLGALAGAAIGGGIGFFTGRSSEEERNKQKLEAASTITAASQAKALKGFTTGASPTNATTFAKEFTKNSASLIEKSRSKGISEEEREKVLSELKQREVEAINAIVARTSSEQEMNAALDQLQKSGGLTSEEFAKLRKTAIDLKAAQQALIKVNFDNLKVNSAFNAASVALQNFAAGLETGYDPLEGFINTIKAAQENIGMGEQGRLAIQQARTQVMGTVPAGSPLAGALDRSFNNLTQITDFTSKLGPALETANLSAIPETAKEQLTQIITGLAGSNQDIRKVAQAEISKLEGTATQDVSGIIENITNSFKTFGNAAINSLEKNLEYNKRIATLTQKRLELEAKYIDAQKQVIDAQLEAASIIEEFGGPKVKSAQRSSATLGKLNLDLRAAGVGGLATPSASGLLAASSQASSIFSRQQAAVNRQVATGGQTVFTGASGIENDLRDKSIKAQESILQSTRDLISQKKEELALAQKKNELERSAIDKLLSGDVQGYIEEQSASAAASAIRSGDTQLAKLFGPTALSAGLKSLQGQGLSDKEMERATRTALGGFAGAGSMAKVYAGTTPEMEAIKTEGMALAETLREVTQNLADIQRMNIEANNVVIRATQIQWEKSIRDASDASSGSSSSGQTSAAPNNPASNTATSGSKGGSSSGSSSSSAGSTPATGATVSSTVPSNVNIDANVAINVASSNANSDQIQGAVKKAFSDMIGKYKVGEGGRLVLETGVV